MKTYICESCGSSFRLAEKPNFCPKCASSNVRPNTIKAEKYAEAQIARFEELKPKMEKAFDEYASMYGEMEAIRVTLRKYKERGIITEEQIPKLVMPKLSKKLAEYRKERTESKRIVEN